jgi:hypothetical protein
MVATSTKGMALRLQASMHVKLMDTNISRLTCALVNGLIAHSGEEETRLIPRVIKMLAPFCQTSKVYGSRSTDEIRLFMRVMLTDTRQNNENQMTYWFFDVVEAKVIAIGVPQPG